MKDIDGFTDKQRRFIEEYLTDYNGTQAAIRSGYSVPTARVQAHRLLRREDVRTAIRMRMAQLSQHADTGARKALQRFNLSGSARRRQADSKQGSVYVLRADNGLVKIGRSSRVKERIRSLQTLLPYDLEILLLIEAGDCAALEADLHQRYGDQRVRGEWFRLSAADIAALQEQYCSADGGTNDDQC